MRCRGAHLAGYTAAVLRIRPRDSRVLTWHAVRWWRSACDRRPRLRLRHRGQHRLACAESNRTPTAARRGSDRAPPRRRADDHGFRSAGHGAGLDGHRGGSHFAVRGHSPCSMPRSVRGAALRPELTRAVCSQQGRRGIVKVRELLPLADARAESPMESECRLVMIDGGLPRPVLQHEVVDAGGRLRRLVVLPGRSTKSLPSMTATNGTPAPKRCDATATSWPRCKTSVGPSCR